VSKRKLLLADDSITIQKVVNLTFADEGIEVIAFGNGDDAVESIDEVRPDIVLADVNMPGLNGYQICELIRANEGTKHIPVVLLVGSFEPFDQAEADRVGADRHMTKPFSSIAELVSTVHALLPETPVEEAERPDTSDIETLYEQSFVETVELPRNGDLGVEFSDDGIDDEMIQTTYADSDIEALTDASFTEADELDEFIGEVDAEPQAEHAAPAFENSLDKPEVENDEVHAAFTTESIDYEPQPEYQIAETGSFNMHDIGSTGLKFEFDDADILELPGAQARNLEFTPAAPTASENNQVEVVNLSPELIDLIVQKVVDKLAEKH
jgi:CheY-like chemotaxis protein